MILYNIKDMPRLYRALDGCQADVDWVGEGGAVYSWRQYGSMLRSLPIKGMTRVEVVTHCAQDAQRLIRYLTDRRDIAMGA